MSKTKKSIVIASLLILSALIFSGCSSSKSAQPQYKLTLEVWGFDDADVFAEAFGNYTKLNPNVVDIKYKKQVLDVTNYKESILDALASGQGPDIFLIHNTWLPMYKDKISEAPVDVINEQKVKNNFVDVVLADFVEAGKVFALPLSVDSLALYYNKDLFNEAGITAPPEDWDTFVSDTKKMTKIDGTGQITQSGAALGTAYNINRSTDILALLMLQNGAVMTDDNKTNAIFGSSRLVGGASPGKNALDFYINFAKTNSAAYSWNNRMHNSIDAFSENNLAMMLNYSWQREALLSKSPKLNFDVAPLPQLAGRPPISYANYWGFAVVKNKLSGTTLQSGGKAVSAPSNDVRIKEAWKLITYLTTKPEISSNSTPPAESSNDVDPNYDAASKYMEETAKPAARRDLIEIQKSDTKSGVFARQNLIAKSWYQADALAIEGIMAEMIDQVNGGQMLTDKALSSAASKVSLIMQNKYKNNP